jgi:tRNA A-37 threonylcarbamoyl transferase component Bud32
MIVFLIILGFLLLALNVLFIIFYVQKTEKNLVDLSKKVSQQFLESVKIKNDVSFFDSNLKNLHEDFEDLNFHFEHSFYAFVPVGPKYLRRINRNRKRVRYFKKCNLL